METIEKLSIDLSKITISPVIDRQHAELLVLLNKLIDQYHKTTNRKHLAEILSILTDYGQAHFREEENFMEQHNYPLIRGHVKSHQEYTYKVAMYNYRFFEPDAPGLFEVVSYIRNWWTFHLLEWDSHLVGLGNGNTKK